MTNRHENRLIKYQDRIEKLMSDLTNKSDAEGIKSDTKKLKSELRAARNLDHSIDDAYLHFPKLNSNPFNGDWHSAFYDAYTSLDYAIHNS